jgi:hypothetical protein
MGGRRCLDGGGVGGFRLGEIALTAHPVDRSRFLATVAGSQDP